MTSLEPIAPHAFSASAQKLGLNEKIQLSFKLADVAMQDHFWRAGDAQGIEIKADGSQVTSHDKGIERECFERFGPDVLGEETHSRVFTNPHDVFKLQEVTIIDPIDGTRHFINNSRHHYTSAWGQYQISNGCMTPTFGAVLLPNKGEAGLLLVGGEGTALEIDLASGCRDPLAVDRSATRATSIRFATSETKLRKFIDPSKTENVDVVPFFGASVADLTSVIRGKADVSFIAAKIWDVAGPIAIGKAVGCGLYRLDSGEPFMGFRAEDLNLGGPGNPWTITAPLMFCRNDKIEKVRDVLLLSSKR